MAGNMTSKRHARLVLLSDSSLGGRVHVSRLPLLVVTITACAGEPIAPRPVARVLISPVNPLVVVTDSVRLTATGHDASDSALADRGVQWSSSDPTIATVSSTGAVTAKSLGSVEIRAAMEQQTATTTISVVPVPVGSRVSNFFMAFSWPGNAYTGPIPTQPYYGSGCP